MVAAASVLGVGSSVVVTAFERQYFNHKFEVSTSLTVQSWSCSVANTSMLLAAMGLEIVPILTGTSSYYTAAGTYNYTVPPGTTAVSLTMIGGGGNGAGNYSTPQGWPSPGGGSAAYFDNVFVPVTPGSVIPITVGGVGQASVFGSYIAGAGGDAPARDAANAGNGGAGGIAIGAGGVDGTAGNNGVMLGGDGYGANSPYGNGGVGVSSGNGGNATGFGAGGGGGGNNSSGGSGSPGFVSIQAVSESIDVYSLIFSGAHQDVFNDKSWTYKTTKYDSSIVTVTNYNDIPATFYKAVAFQADPITTTSVTWTLETNRGQLTFSQQVRNHWSLERDRVLKHFIRRGTLVDYSTSLSVYVDTALNDLPDIVSTYTPPTVSRFFEYNFTVRSTTTNLSIPASTLTAAGWDGIKPVYITITIDGGVILGAADTTNYALDIGAGNNVWPGGSSCRIINNGYIVGAGGAGASGTGAQDKRPGNPGGPAIRTRLKTYITNNGIIGGGGGGEGRKGYGGSYGGGGSGGAGYVPGTCDTTGGTGGTAGTLLLGGGSYVNGSTTAPEPTQYATYGSTLGQDGNVGAYGGLGGVGGYVITGVEYVSYVSGQNRVHGRTRAYQ